MKTHGNLLFLALAPLAAVLWSCSDEGGMVNPVDDNPYEPIALDVAESQVGEVMKPFAFDLLGEISRQTDGSVVVSPLSAALMAGMLANAADVNASAELLGAMGVSEVQKPWLNSYFRKLLITLPSIDKTSKMQLDNGAWLNNGAVEPPKATDDYRSVMRGDYLTEISYLDFSDGKAAGTINDWIYKRTGFDNVIEDLDRSMAAIWVATLYFHGEWTNKFKKDATKRQPFFLSDGSSREVDMMHSKNVGAGYYFRTGSDAGINADETIQSVTMPYGNGAYHFTAVLPARDMSVADLIRALADGVWGDIALGASGGGIRSGVYGVCLPRMEITSDHDMRRIWSAMGVNDLFDGCTMPGVGISSPVVGKIVQKVSISVDEDGSEVKAVTSGGMEGACVPEYVAFNRPFVYVVWEKSTGVILAAGTYMGS